MISRMTAVALLCAISATASAQAPAGNPAPATTMTQESVNVFRRFSADREKELAFYGEVVGLQAGRGFNMPSGGQMSILNIGTSQFKFTGAGGRQDPSGPVLDVTGLRVFSFFYCSEADLTARFASHGYVVPEFHSTAGRRSAMVTDPDGQWVELVVGPCDAPPHFEIGATVTDVQKSRAFYRAFVGLDELPPVDSRFGRTYRFALGPKSANLLNLWAAHAGAAANTSTAGIQYVVSDVEAVNARAKANAVTVTQPLGMFGAGLRTVWLADPDGITNYFAQLIRTTQR
jgi:predicted enzyme related to lactoylglutathione lyase